MSKIDKFIAVSDIHFHKYQQFNEDNRRLKNEVRFIKYLFKFAHVNGIDNILHSGDLYNLMQIISTETEVALIETFSECFDTYPTINFISISGNHDYATKNLLNSPAVSAQETLAVVFHDRYKLIDYKTYHLGTSETGQEIYVHGIPYFEYPEHFRATLEKVKTKRNSINILLIHQMIAMTNGVVEDDIEPDDKSFDPFTYVFNGHVHEGKQITANLFNIGSPKHRDAGDVGKDRGFWVFYTDEEGGFEFISTNDKFPQYRYKTIGTPLINGEENDYIIWQQPETDVSKDDSMIMESFAEAGTPEQAVEIFGKENNLDKQTISYGIKLLT